MPPHLAVIDPPALDPNGAAGAAGAGTAAGRAAPLALSLVIPVYNEEQNVEPIYRRITEVLAGGPERYRDSYEILFVDDGSRDGSHEACARLHRQDPRVIVVQFRRNFGKTAALHAGFRLSRGERVITIDADMQEDPGDMFRLLERMDDGRPDQCDMVSAWRERRNDPLSKTLPSKVFNFVVSRATGIGLHDFNCGFKAYTREVLDAIGIYGEQHRFIPVLVKQHGFEVGEVPVTHQPRKFGKSKFGGRRLGRGYLDFLQVLFLVSYLRRPLRLFGGVGTFFTLAGFLICLYLTFIKLVYGESIGGRPLLLLGILLVISGLQFISTGLLGEMLRHGHYKSEGEYAVRKVLKGKD